MPITAALDCQKRVFRTTVTGVVTIGDMARHISTVRQTAAYRYPALIDARGVERLSFSRRDLTNFVHHMKSILEPGRPAPRAVVVGNLSYFGIARFIASLVVGWMRVGVFDDIASAEEWLDGIHSGTLTTARPHTGAHGSDELSGWSS